jgi:hypothetical protein
MCIGASYGPDDLISPAGSFPSHSKTVSSSAGARGGGEAMDNDLHFRVGAFEQILRIVGREIISEEKPLW